jgi:hypothetical protein
MVEVLEVEVSLLATRGRPKVPTPSTYNASTLLRCATACPSLTTLSGSGRGLSQSTRIDREPSLLLNSVSCHAAGRTSFD